MWLDVAMSYSGSVKVVHEILEITYHDLDELFTLIIRTPTNEGCDGAHKNATQRGGTSVVSSSS